jgi:hypothetical protein
VQVRLCVLAQISPPGGDSDHPTRAALCTQSWPSSSSASSSPPQSYTFDGGGDGSKQSSARMAPQILPTGISLLAVPADASDARMANLARCWSGQADACSPPLSGQTNLGRSTARGAASLQTRSRPVSRSWFTGAARDLAACHRRRNCRRERLPWRPKTTPASSTTRKIPSLHSPI